MTFSENPQSIGPVPGNPLVRLYLRLQWVFLGILLVLMALYAAYLLLSATSIYGIGIRSDSVAYIWSARNLAAGLGLGRLDGAGLFKPMTHWPPLYPLILSIFPMAGIDAVEGARWLAAALSGLNVAIAGWILARMTRSTWFEAGGAAVLLYSPALAETNLQAMTEPVYIAFGLLALLALDGAIHKGQRRFVLLAAVFTSLAFLTRYVGLALVMTGALGILLYGMHPIRRRGADLLIFLTVSVVPSGLWALRNTLLSGSAANRAFTFYPISASDFGLALTTVQGWVLPVGTVFSVGAGKILLAAAGAAGAFLLAKLGLSHSTRQNPPTALLDLNQMLLGFYLVMVLLSRLFFDPLITFFEQRILAPAYISVVVLVVAVLHSAWQGAQNRRWWLGAVVAVFCLWSAYSFIMVYRTESGQIYDTMLNNGSGYAYKGEMDSPFAGQLRQIPEGAVVFTSNIEKFYFLSGKPAYGYPSDFDAAFIKSVQDMIVKKTVVFVSFHRDDASWKIIHEELAGLQAVYEDGNALIYTNHPWAGEN